MGLRGLVASIFAIVLGATLFWGIALQGELAFPSAPGTSHPVIHFLEAAASSCGLVLMGAGALWFGVSAAFFAFSHRAHPMASAESSDEGAGRAFTP